VVDSIVVHPQRKGTEEPAQRRIVPTADGNEFDASESGFLKGEVQRCLGTRRAVEPDEYGRICSGLDVRRPVGREPYRLVLQPHFGDSRSASETDAPANRRPARTNSQPPSQAAQPLIERHGGEMPEGARCEGLSPLRERRESVKNQSCTSWNHSRE
jgi:hypothetical protein